MCKYFNYSYVYVRWSFTCFTSLSVTCGRLGFSPNIPISYTNKIERSEKKRNIVENGDKQNQKQT
jgi:hypothetical protein